MPHRNSLGGLRARMAALCANGLLLPGVDDSK